MKKIKLGYEMGTGEKVEIDPSHLIVTGLTQLSGKTTTLEALIKRSELKAIVFKTKIGEKSFGSSQEVPPFFRDRSDYEFVKSLIEAYSKEKLFIEKGTLMQLCKGSGNLVEIKKKVDDKIAEGKLRGLKEEIFTRLQHYLENLIPQIQYANFSKTLQIGEGINVMNLERFSEEAQSLIIQSVSDEVLKTLNGIILVLPEGWKFIPQKYNNPCKRTIESYIRQGAANKNFIWIDSQDMAGVDKIPLKQISTWILGFQSERNEVKHTLDQIAIPKSSKPKEEEIMTLKKGHFIISSPGGVKKVYVQPVWLDDENAIKIAKGELELEDVMHLEGQLQEKVYGKSIAESIVESESANKTNILGNNEIKKQVNQLRIDFFNKITEIVEEVRKVYGRVYTLENKNHEIPDLDEIVALVLQKMPVKEDFNNQTPNSIIDEETLIRKVIAKMPKSSGSVTYEVFPQEKLKKDYQENTKQMMINEISELSKRSKEILKWVEANGNLTSRSEIVLKLWNWKATTRAMEDFKQLDEKNLVKKDSRGRLAPFLKDRIKNTIAVYGPTEEEITNTYNHILMEMLK